MKSLRVCVYNYKGGAAKTTIVVNTAAALAHPDHGNKKTLLIDLDPQCNSTQFYHDDNETLGGGRTLQKEETEPTGTGMAAEALAHGLPSGGTEPELISDALHPSCDAASMDALVSNKGRSPLYRIMHALFVDNEASEVRHLIETEGFQLLSQVNLDEHTKQSEFGDNFWVLEGDPTISEFEANIAHAFSNYGSKGFVKHYGLISYLMQVMTEVLGFDVIMIDCSPSNSALNKAAALSCDYILPPCMASLYSAGSVAGLLSSVLPGDDGWLGLHDKITRRWREDDGEPKAEIAGLREWLLPSSPPVLLPILVSNYPMGLKSDSMKCEPIPGARRRRGGAQPPSLAHQPSVDARVVNLMHTQFIYTIMNFVNQECRHVAGHEKGRPDGFVGPLVRFRENRGRRVINFAESAPISMPVSEQVGRSFVELQIVDFLFYMYGEQKTSDMLEEATKEAEAAASKAGKTASGKRKASQAGMIDYGPDGQNFVAEVETMRKRYSALSDWLVHLLVEKRGGPAAAAAAPPAAAAAAGPSSS